ncbi:hypothetical protein HQQ80_20095 [Microbacteriaceae bacterium VKM Ac-2855]|nr:hypothetical protein [Microbacteriaceae bacterium VKM Ac-2855]
MGARPAQDGVPTVSSFNYPSNHPDEPSLPVPPENPAEVDDPEDDAPDEGADARLRLETDDTPSRRLHGRHRAEPDGSDPGVG